MSNIEFSAAGSDKRPIRLCEKTRVFAYESMNGKYGDEAVKSFCLELEAGSLDCLTPYERYDACIDKIVHEAPLRIIDDELISGAATLGMAITHNVPVKCGGQTVYQSVSHLTCDFAGMLKTGIIGAIERVDAELSKPALTEQEFEVLTSIKKAAQALIVWHGRYLDALRGVSEEKYRLLERVPLYPPQSFKKAVQSLWFMFAFTRLCGNWPGIGRIDEMLGDYLENDLKSGRIDIDTAREYLAHFFIKGCEWIQSETPRGSGDAQHYQNLVLSGINEAGFDVTNKVTYLALEIVEETGISDYPITVRISEKTDPKLLSGIASVMRHGGGVVAVYNEPLILRAMERYGYDPIKARNFANDGCWEVQIPGFTNFSYMPFDSYRILTERTLGIKGEHKHYNSYDELFEAFMQDLRAHLCAANAPAYGWRTGGGDEFTDVLPCSVISLFVQDCIGRHKGYHGGGAVYNILSPHIGGAPDAANSLYAIKKLVFDDKITTLEELLSAVESNWEDNEPLRLTARNKYTYFGNDNPECDEVYAAVLNGFAEQAKAEDKYDLIGFPPGVSTFGRQIEWAPYRTASPFGYKKGDILSGNASPTPGTETEGATSIIRSYCAANLELQTTGAALDIRLHPDSTQGQEGITALVSLMRGFILLGGFFMQIDVADVETLRRAQKNPELYKTLSVRVSGWNARFVTLNKEWQEMIIEQNGGKKEETE